ncbi:rhodanese-like domain-containing protein [Rhizobacter sp. LjRoot28]|uniref:rhodanese-like domain-containing protein n=1 Tax=Rhizobacter sp. LjRoot28 TaxID=3342309 RepID=UPI003ECD3E82
MNKLRVLTSIALVLASGNALAELSAMMAIEPTSRKEGLMISRSGMEAGLSRAIGQAVTVITSDDLADVMRSTRSGGHDLFIAPAQVAASALARGYELVGSTAPAEQYVLVGRHRFTSAESVRGNRIYLPQQDSIYTYMARGMLNATGLSFKDLKTVEHARYPQAGLTALSVGVSDATVIRQADWADWEKENPGVARVLATSGAVPGGFSVVMKSDLPADVRARIAKWFAAPTSPGLRPVTERVEMAAYKSVAQLGTFTPTHLPGAKVVTATEVKQLLAQGAVMVDTRTEKEYKAKRVPGAILVPYGEKSLKDVAYDAGQDDFKGLGQLDKGRPTVFACNGAECWKSYKASRSALAAGFKQVYWFRGGLPEWDAAGLTVAKD